MNQPLSYNQLVNQMINQTCNYNQPLHCQTQLAINQTNGKVNCLNIFGFVFYPSDHGIKKKMYFIDNINLNAWYLWLFYATFNTRYTITTVKFVPPCK